MALRGAMKLAEVRHAAGSSHWYPHEVTDVCLQACLGQHTVNLSPVMRLVVEEVHQEHRFRLGHIAFGRTRVPSEVAFDPSGGEPAYGWSRRRLLALSAALRQRGPPPRHRGFRSASDCSEP